MDKIKNNFYLYVTSLTHTNLEFMDLFRGVYGILTPSLGRDYAEIKLYCDLKLMVRLAL